MLRAVSGRPRANIFVIPMGRCEKVGGHNNLSLAVFDGQQRGLNVLQMVSDDSPFLFVQLRDPIEGPKDTEYRASVGAWLQCLLATLGQA